MLESRYEERKMAKEMFETYRRDNFQKSIKIDKRKNNHFPESYNSRSNKAKNGKKSNEYLQN